MEIKDALSIYDFIGKLGLVGGGAVAIILIAIVSYLMAGITEKLIENKKLRIKIVGTIALLITIAMITIVINSNVKQKHLNDATAIKNYMLSKKWKWMGFRRIAMEINLDKDKLAIDTIQQPNKDQHRNDSIRITVRADAIKTLLREFPEEFIEEKVDDYYTHDQYGIELIDTVALKIIDKYNDEMSPFFRAKILNYMQSKKIDTIYYSGIRNEIDDRLHDFLIDRLIAKYNDDFVAINIYDYYWKYNWYALKIVQHPSNNKPPK